MADLDLTDFMKEGSGGDVAKLDWLDVDEKAYREADRLPKQNLDIGPDLAALWSHDESSSLKFVPNKGEAKTMADLSQLHGHVGKSEDLVRVARLAIMQTTDPRKIGHALTSRFDSDTIRAGKTALAGVLAERGLLGRFYIEAADFPDCAQGGKSSAEFVRRFAGDAKFVKAKEACGGCVHRRQAIAGGSSHCGVFHKEIVLEVPYTEALATEVEKLQAAKGKAVQASVGAPRDRIRQAHLSGTAQAAEFTGQWQAPQKPIDTSNVSEKLVAVANLTKKRDQAAQEKVAAEKARPIVEFLRREMLKGHGPRALAHSLRLAYDQRDLQETRAHWEPLFREAGLYGVVYTTQDSFDDCREGAGFLSKHASSVKAVVAGKKCESCIFAKVGRCMMYGRKLVRNASDIVTAETVAAMVDEHKIAGRLPFNAQHYNWGATPAEALKTIHRVASMPQAMPVDSRMAIEQAFHGNGPRQVQASELTKRNIVKVARQYLNEGLYGEDLLAALKHQFEVRDIRAAVEDLRPVVAEQGLQGIKYIDPTAYDDYGKGCKEAASKHRSRGSVKYAKVGSKCGSCVHQTRPGFCSVLAKQLVVEPPYVNKAEEQRAILASGRSIEVPYEALMNNGLSMMQEYELQHTASSIELNPQSDLPDVGIEFGFHKDVKL